MPKLSKESVKVREEFVLKLFATNPDSTVGEVNVALKAKFGHAMRPGRVSELKVASIAPNGLLQIAEPTTGTGDDELPF